MQVCLNIPSIVYQNVFAGQTSNLSNVAIYTPSGSGLFRVTATAYANASPVNVNATIQNGTGPSDSSISFGGGFTNGQAGTGVFTGRSSNAFLLSTSATGLGSGSFDLYVTVEQLQ